MGLNSCCLPWHRSQPQRTGTLHRQQKGRSARRKQNCCLKRNKKIT